MGGGRFWPPAHSARGSPPARRAPRRVCDLPPRPANAASPRVAVSSDWFVVYRAAEGSSPWWPEQFQEAISYVILGRTRADVRHRARPRTDPARGRAAHAAARRRPELPFSFRPRRRQRRVRSDPGPRPPLHTEERPGLSSRPAGRGTRARGLLSRPAEGTRHRAPRDSLVEGDGHGCRRGEDRPRRPDPGGPPRARPCAGRDRAPRSRPGSPVDRRLPLRRHDLPFRAGDEPRRLRAVHGAPGGARASAPAAPARPQHAAAEPRRCGAGRDRRVRAGEVEGTPEPGGRVVFPFEGFSILVAAGSVGRQGQ